MQPLRRTAARIARVPGLRRLRVATGRVVSPEIRDHLKMLDAAHADVSDHITTLYHRSLNDNHRISELESSVAIALQQSKDLQDHMPAVLNAIASTNGTSRLLRRELGDVHVALQAEREELARRLTEIDGHIHRLDGHVRDEVWPLVAKSEGWSKLGETVEWLIGRVETVRAEALHEIQYRQNRDPAERANDVEIINPDSLQQNPLRLNLGCGHLPIEGFVNVDMRPLPGVDVVAAVDAIPVDEGSVSEIFSAHVLEHFPHEQLVRQLLPYWRSRLSPGGTFRAVVPDIEAMIEQYQKGEIAFDALRQVAYGGQEYEGDFHHTAFTPDSMRALLRDAGFTEVELIERARVNGACLEFEMSARRPT